MRIAKTAPKPATVLKPRTRKSVSKAFESAEIVLKSLFSNGASTKEQLQEAINLKAYELFVQRGYAHGHAQEDWLKAEQIILGAKR